MTACGSQARQSSGSGGSVTRAAAMPLSAEAFFSCALVLQPLQITSIEIAAAASGDEQSLEVLPLLGELGIIFGILCPGVFEDFLIRGDHDLTGVDLALHLGKLGLGGVGLRLLDVADQCLMTDIAVMPGEPPARAEENQYTKHHTAHSAAQRASQSPCGKSGDHAAHTRANARTPISAPAADASA